MIVGCSQPRDVDENLGTSSSATPPEDSSADDATTEFASDNEIVTASPSANTEVNATEKDASKEVEPALADIEIDACLFVLEWRLTRTRPDDVVFVAFGRGEDGWIDPSTAAMKRLSEIGLNLLPASKARLPKPGEMESDNRYRGVEDPKTGKRSYIYHASVAKWIDDRTAEVSYGNYGGPLASGGGSVVVEKKGGQWSVKEHKGGWVS